MESGIWVPRKLLQNFGTYRPNYTVAHPRRCCCCSRTLFSDILWCVAANRVHSLVEERQHKSIKLPSFDDKTGDYHSLSKNFKKILTMQYGCLDWVAEHFLRTILLSNWSFSPYIQALFSVNIVLNIEDFLWKGGSRKNGEFEDCVLDQLITLPHTASSSACFWCRNGLWVIWGTEI
jgi:hypothetical protein